MSLLPDYALNSDPLDERQKDDPEGLYKSATQAYDDVVGQPTRGLRGPGIQVADASGASWREQLSALEKTAQPAAKAAPAAAAGAGWRAQLAALETPPAPEQGDFSRGLSVSGKQLKQTAYGTAALVGDTLGVDSLKEWGLKGYKDAEKEVQAISKESDSFTNAWEMGEMGKWMTYNAGYLLGQVGEMGVASLAGAAIGTVAAPGAGTAAGAVAGAVEKGAAQAGIRAFVGKMIDKEAAEMVAKGVAKDVAAQQAVKSVYRSIGATTANTFLNATQELGSIYGDAVQEAIDKGQDYSLGRVWLAGIAATAVDSWADSKALGKFMGALGGDKAIKGVAMEALKGGFREGMTEGVQTAIERWGADKDLTSQEAFKEYIDSAAVGILGGGVAGGASGAINKFTTPTETKGKPLDEKAPAEIETTSNTRAAEPVDTTDLPPITQRELMETIGDKGAVAYLYSIATPEQRKSIEMAVDRAGPDFRQSFDSAVGRQDMIDAGAQMLAEAPVQRERLFDAIEQLAVTQPKPGKVKVPMTKPITEQERLAEMEAANQALMAGTVPAAKVQETPAPVAQPMSQPVTWETLRPGQQVTLYRGESAQNEAGGQWWTTSESKAQRYGAVTAVTLPSEVVGRNSVQGANGIDEFVFPSEGRRPQDLAAAPVSPATQQISQPPVMPSARVNAMPDLEADVAAAEHTFTPAQTQAQAPAAVVTEEQRAKVTPYFESQAQKLLGMKFSAKRKNGMDTLTNEMRVMGFSDEQINRVTTTGSLGEPAPVVQAATQTNLDDVNAELQAAREDLKDSLYNLWDVYSDATGLKKNITGQKHTVSDLPKAIQKVMEDLVKLGYVKFKDIVRELMKRMRESKNWSQLTGQVTPAMLRNAYNSLPQFKGKETPDAVKAVTREELAPLVKGDQEKSAAEESNKLDLEIIAENKRLEEKHGKNWTKTAPKEDLVKLESLKKRQKELVAELEEEARVAKPRRLTKKEEQAAEEDSAPEVDFGRYNEAKPKDQKEQPAKLSIDRQTETVRKLLGGLGSRDTSAVLARLNNVSDEWIASLDSPGVADHLMTKDGKDRVDAILSIAERDVAWVKRFGERMQALSTGEAKTLLDFKARVYRIMNLVHLSAPEIVQKLGVSSTSPNKGVTDRPSVQEQISAVEAAEQAKMFRDTIAKMQAAVDAIDKQLRDGRKITDKSGKKFEGVDETDENAYLWGEQGFRTQKDLPQDRLLAIRRGLIDDIREMQTRSTRGIATLFKNAARNAAYMLEIERREAIKNGVPEMVVNPIIQEATQSLSSLELKENGPLTNIPSLNEVLQKTLDETPFEAFDAVQELADGIKGSTLSNDEMFLLTSAAIRSGRMNYGQLVQALRDRGLDIPQEMISTAPLLASQVRMLDYVRQHGGNPAYRQAWLTSMDELVRRRPSLLKLNVFTEAEKTAYELWKDRVNAVASRRKTDFVMENSKNASDAFRDLLFVKYSLSQMRGEVPIPEREASALKGTLGDMVEAWFQDVDFALRTRPDLANQLLDKEDGLLAPTDVEQFRQWQRRQERVKQRQADVMARIPYFDALNNIDGALPKDALGGETEVDGFTKRRNSIYRKTLQAIARARLDQLDQVLANAHELYTALASANVSMKPSILEQKIQEFLEMKMVKDQMINGQSISEFFGMSNDRGNETLSNSDEGIDYVEQDDADIERNANLGLDSYEAGDEDNLSPLRRGFFSGVLTAAHVQATVARITASWKSAPQITVLQNATLLPEPLRSRVLAKLDGDVGAKGVFDSETGMVYLFADHLAGDADTEFTLFHEVYGHLGMRGLLGAKFDTFLENMYRIYPGVRKAADALIDGGTPKLEAIEEVLSDAAASNDKVGAVKQFVGRVASGLRSIGLGRVADWVGQLTNAELMFHLNAARDFAQNGGYKAIDGMPSEIRLAEARLPYELFSQKGDKTTAYARFNPVTQTWALFRAFGDDIRDKAGYESTVHEKYEDVLEAMRKLGKLERRKRSGLFVDDKLPGDMPSLAAVTDPVGVKRWMRDLITKYQNEYKPVFDVVDYLRSKGRITEQMDVKTALMLYERRTGAVIESFRTKYVEPLKMLIDEAGKAGADYGVINTYLLARHAEERNKQIARINPNMPDKGSGMYTDDAKKFLAETEGKPYAEALEEIGRLMDKMSTAKLHYQVNTGMITRKAAAAMEATYKHYVNLSGQNDKLDKFDDPSALAGGSKFNVKGKEARAFGRSDPASDILARTVLGMEASLIRGQKNLVAQRLLAMLEANYDPNFAVVNEIAYRRQIGEDGMVMETEDAEYIKRKDVMVAKINGIPVTMRFKDTSPGSFAEAIHGMVYPPEASPWINAIGRYNQIMGQMLTTWNPAWVAVNFARDAQTMYFNAASDGRITKAQAFQMVKLLPTAIKHAYALAFPQSKFAANMVIDPDIRRVYDEMKREGGLTSFLNRKDLEAQVDEIHTLLHERTKLQNIGDKFKALGDVLEHLTLPMEIAPRLAAYKVVRDNGFSAAEAAKFSGEITVNFNMRGSNKEIRKLFLFFNPAVQGSAKMVDLIRKNPGRVATYASAFVALGAIANLVGRALSDDDESGRNSLDKVPTYKRATSIVLSADVPGAAIPIPYGWNAFYALGHFMMDSVLGVQPVSESAKRVAKTAFEAFTPMGTAGLDSSSTVGMVAKGIAPTAALPVVEWLMNENRYGAPIRKEGDMFGGAQLPNSEMAFRSVSPISQSMATGLNELTGGNKARAGVIDVNPAAIDFLIGSYLPGFVNEAYKGASTAVRVARGEEVKNTPLPLIDRFTAKTPEGFDAGAFRRAKELTETRYKEFDLYPERRDEIRKELPGLMKAHAIVASTTQELRKMRSDFQTFERNPRATEQEIVERKNRLMEREKAAYQRAVKAVMEAGPEFREAVMAGG